MNEIVMIPIGMLEHHPENPRKDLGDLTELAESIRKNGVMQNLTVIPEAEFPGDDHYLVVIGNRRLEAAKMAGLEALPCVISNMGYKEQISTMLQENMQRADLTVYEQAQGFQMMMDLGLTEAEVSDMTGFSRTTVKRRVKMAELAEAEEPEKVEPFLHIYSKDDLLKIVDEAALKVQADKAYRWGSDSLELQMFHDARSNAVGVGVMKLRNEIRRMLKAEEDDDE